MNVGLAIEQVDQGKQPADQGMRNSRENIVE